MNSSHFLLAAGLLAASCSPLRSSPNDEKHQLELTLHELRTNLDDQRHDLNCFQTELQILDGRIKYYESALSNLKQQDLEKQQTKLDQFIKDLQALDKKISLFERSQTEGSKDLLQLTSHANETSAALAQFKQRLIELEQDLQQQNRRFEEIAKVKIPLDHSAKTYRVRSGDTLEKIARLHKVSVERLRKANDLSQDLIVVGQELRIPNE